jgi:hypothetical protein
MPRRFGGWFGAYRFNSGKNWSLLLDNFSVFGVFRGLESSPLFCRRGSTPVSACHIGIGLDNVAN